MDRVVNFQSLQVMEKKRIIDFIWSYIMSNALCSGWFKRKSKVELNRKTKWFILDAYSQSIHFSHLLNTDQSHISWCSSWNLGKIDLHLSQKLNELNRKLPLPRRVYFSNLEETTCKSRKAHRRCICTWLRIARITSWVGAYDYKAGRKDFMDGG